MQTVPAAVELLECRPIPSTRCARMDIVCDAECANDVMYQVMRSVDAAEFGPLSPA
jgi:hypothetical protein